MPLSIVGTALATTNTVTVPAARQVGDLIVCVAIRAEALNTTTPALPSAPTFSSSGWQVFSAGDIRTRFGSRISDGTEGNVTWPNAFAVGCIVYRGWDVADPIGGFASPGVGTSSSANYSLTTLERSNGTSWRLGVVVAGSAATIGSPPAGWTRNEFADDGTFKYLIDHAPNITNGNAVIPAYSFGATVTRTSISYEIKAEPDPVAVRARPLVNDWTPILVNGGLAR